RTNALTIDMLNGSPFTYFSNSVSADPNMARSSRLVIPYTDGTAGPAVLQVDPPAHNPVGPGEPVNALTVHLSHPASPGTFTAASLTLTLNGAPIRLDGRVVTVTQDAQDPSAYRISGLKAYQTQAGVYVGSAVIRIQAKFDRAVTVTPGAMNQLPF